MDSLVLLQVDDVKKYTSIKANTDSPYYNEFNNTTLEILIDKPITITVLRPGSLLRKRKAMGTVTMDIATIWYQPDHQVYHKWVVLSAPSRDLVGGTRGYLKIDFAVLSKGQTPKFPKCANTDDIEGNLFLSEKDAMERQRVNFAFSIYHGRDIRRKNCLSEVGLRKRPDPTPASTSLEIIFSKTRIRGTVRKNTSNPQWNEKLNLTELFPPFCQRFKFELNIDGTIYVRFLDLKTISSDRDQWGFLPTFGPTYINFYSSNHLEGFVGQILIGMETQLLQDIDVKSTPTIQVAQQIDQEVKLDEFVVFASIFDVTWICKKFSSKSIVFRMACGPIMSDGGIQPKRAKLINKNLFYLGIEERKPCLFLKLTLPDLRKSMYNFNLLRKISQELKFQLNQIEENFHIVQHLEIEEALSDLLSFLTVSAEKYIDIASSYEDNCNTSLERKLLILALREMEEIRKISQSISIKTHRLKKSFQKLDKLHRRIQTLIHELEDLPKIYLWMICGNKRVAYAIVDPKTIIYSMVEEEKGQLCGKIQTIFFQTHEDNFTTSPCKMDVVLWMGLQRHWQDAKMDLVEGFRISPEEIPRNLITEEKHGRAYIFQGRCTPGSDKNGLCDPFLHVVIGDQFRSTGVLRKTLSPIWDQLLIFDKISLYGSGQFLTKNPPKILLELYDKDAMMKVELVGRSVALPKIHMGGALAPKPLLTWWQVLMQDDIVAEILAAFDLVEIFQEPEKRNQKEILRIPQQIKPNLIKFRVEAVFWGVRNLKSIQLLPITKPLILIECVNDLLRSDILPNAKKCLNFGNPVKIFDVVFPEQEAFAPPLFLKMFDCRNFGIQVFAGAHILRTGQFLYRPLTKKQREQKFAEVLLKKQFPSSSESIIANIEDVENVEEEITEDTKANGKKFNCWRWFSCCDGKKKKVLEELEEKSVQNEWNDEDFDWWTKFYASLEEDKVESPLPQSQKYKLTIYPNELESNFDNFHDLLRPMPMYKGKKSGDEEVDDHNTTGILKGNFSIYPYSDDKDLVTMSGKPLHQGVFQDLPSNNPTRFTLRVYCVRGLGLRPKDLNGKSDPYLTLTLNKRVICDKENRIMRNVNPIFGRCFEFDAVFPEDYQLKIAVFDWDLSTADDLIGETRIDLENRFYTNHRGHCGLAQDYLTSGYCRWRDQAKPTLILETLCRKWNLSGPDYGATSVRVACNQFDFVTFQGSGDAIYDREVLALMVLHRWEEIPLVGCRLVPEHVETRSLYHPKKPGLEQGKLQLWIDIFPCIDLPTPMQVDITPRKPVAYELRVIIWNTDNVQLQEDDFFTGQKKSDIFVKGWLIGPNDDGQATDVHYRSLTGEGNFNWRFIFNFDYLSTENKMVLKRKESIFSNDETEWKTPCRLILQVWENDTFSPDDFLGVLTLEISKMPRGAQSAKLCNLSIVAAKAPTLNLFKIGRTKGWWPFKNLDEKSGLETFTGAVEAEFELLTKEAALKNPAGCGRNDPQALPKPNRPDTSFSAFKNPLKALKFGLKAYKWKFVKLLIFLLLVLVVLLGVYSFPGYSVKKLLGA